MNSLLRNDAHVIHVFRKFVASMLALSLLLISTVPVVSAAARCNMPGMNMADMDTISMQMQVEPVSPLMDPQDCFIECGCRIDNHLDGMPHQLAPHTLSLTDFDTDFGVEDATGIAVPALLPRHLLYPTPPPRIS